MTSRTADTDNIGTEIVETSAEQRVKELRGRTPQDIAAIISELGRVQASAQDIVVPASAFSLDYDGPEGVRVAIDEKIGGDTAFAGVSIADKYTIGHVAHSQIAAKMGIPARYYGRMLADEPRLLTQNVNTWNTATPRNHMLRTVDGRVRAVLSDGYRALDNFDCATQLGGVCMEAGAQVVELSLNEEHFRFKALKTDWGFKVDNGRGGNDVLIPGITATNSEVGLGALSVAGWLRRTVCTNGMEVSRSLVKVQRIHLGERHDVGLVMSDETRKLKDDALWAEVADMTRAMFDRELVAQLVARINSAASTMLDEPVKAVDAVARAHNLTEAQSAAIVAYMTRPAIPETESGTLWGLINGITQLGHTAGLEEDARLQRVGGELLERGLVGVN